MKKEITVKLTASPDEMASVEEVLNILNEASEAYNGIEDDEAVDRIEAVICQLENLFGYDLVDGNPLILPES